MGQVVQMVGAALVLGAFIAAQQHRLTMDSVIFLALNAVGTGILTVVAGLNGDLGFFVLEGTWAAVSTWGLVRALRKPQLAPEGS